VTRTSAEPGQQAHVLWRTSLARLRRPRQPRRPAGHLSSAGRCTRPGAQTMVLKTAVLPV